MFVSFGACGCFKLKFMDSGELLKAKWWQYEVDWSLTIGVTSTRVFL